VTPNPDPNVRNLKGSKAQNQKEAEAKVADLLRRLKSGEDFALLASNYSEDAGSAANGGDIGFHPISDFGKNPEFLKLIDRMPAGSTSDPVQMPEGFRIFKMISKEPAGQRDLNDPRTQQEIRDELRNQKDQLLKAAYFEVARNNAKVVNYLAQSIVDNAAKTK
jgi:peptidyl-prolyl cis-trans isomerase SurA